MSSWRFMTRARTPRRFMESWQLARKLAGLANTDVTRQISCLDPRTTPGLTSMDFRWQR